MNIGKRIAIVGNTGSGKSTLAGQLSTLHNIPHIELDALFWKPDWEQSSPDEFRQKVEDNLMQAGEKWVTDGNYTVARDIIWTNATTLIWLDYPLYIVYWRLFWRTLKRTLSKEELWNSNKERFWEQFFTRESLFVWAWKYKSRRKKIQNSIMQEENYSHLQVFHFKHPRETKAWLKQLQGASHLT